MNYYERHIGDYLKDTAHLSLLEHGIYTRLLDVYYTRETGIPVSQVERLIGVRSKEERQALAAVLDEFFTVDEETLRQARCDREIERYHDKQSKAARSANARWEKVKAHTDGNANAMRTHSEGNAPSNQTPVTRHQEEKRTRKRADTTRPDDVAESVWNDWVGLRKGHKADASATAVEAARDEAGKAGMTLEAFLRVWCLRGSRGLQADWLKPHERQQASPKSFREQSEEFARAQFAGWAGSALKSQVIEAEADDVPRLTLG